MGGSLDGLDHVVLVVGRRSRAGQMINLIALDEKGLHDIVQEESKVGMAHPVLDVLALAGEQIVQNINNVPLQSRSDSRMSIK